MPKMKRKLGFTLIEMMVTVAVVAILGSVAFPAYTDYTRRSMITEATSTLADFRVRMEQFYQDNRAYAGAGLGGCGATAPAAADARYFTYTCALNTSAGMPAGQSYRATATGNAGTSVAGFVFTVNEQNARATTGMHSSWGSLPADAGTRWVTRKP